MNFRIDNEWPKGIQRPALDSLIVDRKRRIWVCSAVGWEWTYFNGMLAQIWCITITERETGKEVDLSFVDAVLYFEAKQMVVFGHQERKNNE